MLIFEKHKFKDAKGLGIWKSKSKYVEIWIFPSAFTISEHSHSSQNIETMLLFGRAVFCRKTPSEDGVKQFNKKGLFSNLFKCLSIPANYTHWFIVDKSWPLIVINFSSFLDNYKPSSASEDIKFKP